MQHWGKLHCIQWKINRFRIYFKKTLRIRNVLHCIHTVQISKNYYIFKQILRGLYYAHTCMRLQEKLQQFYTVDTYTADQFDKRVVAWSVASRAPSRANTMAVTCPRHTHATTSVLISLSLLDDHYVRNYTKSARDHKLNNSPTTRGKGCVRVCRARGAIS